MRYAVVIGKVDGNYPAYVPDMPGCVATSDGKRKIRVTIRFNIGVSKMTATLSLSR